MVRQWQKLYYKGRMSGSDKSLHRKDFVKAAEADGFAFARKLDKKADIAPTIREFIEFDGPAFLEVIIDPDAGVYPMVGPGLSYSKMITGDWIVSRDEPEDDQPGPAEMFCLGLRTTGGAPKGLQASTGALQSDQSSAFTALQRRWQIPSDKPGVRPRRAEEKFLATVPGRRRSPASRTSIP